MKILLSPQPEENGKREREREGERRERERDRERARDRERQRERPKKSKKSKKKSTNEKIVISKLEKSAQYLSSKEIKIVLLSLCLFNQLSNQFFTAPQNGASFLLLAQSRK